MENNKEPIEAPLQIYNYKKHTALQAKSFQKSIQLFRNELLRLLSEDFGVSLPNQKKYGEIVELSRAEEIKDAFEFWILIDPEKYALSFTITSEGKIIIKLQQDYRNKSRDAVLFLPNTQWVTKNEMPEYAEFLKKVSTELSAAEVYSLLPNVIKYFY